MCSAFSTDPWEMLNLNIELRELDSSIEKPFRRHGNGEVMKSVLVLGPFLSAVVLATTGGDVSGSADRLGCIAGSGACAASLRRSQQNLRRAGTPGLLRASFDKNGHGCSPQRPTRALVVPLVVSLWDVMCDLETHNWGQIETRSRRSAP